MILTPEKNLYGKYGDPYRVAEFRVFSFNSCGAGCKNCFYLKTNNHYYNFSNVFKLAQSLKDNDYTLESCYLLPTDVFENEFNFQVFDNKEFQKVLSLFNYIGLATTLRNGFVKEVFDNLLTFNNQNLKIELHVNLREDLLEDASYITHLEEQLNKIKSIYGDKILINLALNLGSRLTESDHQILKHLVYKYSDDKILEMNFTFLFNPNISRTQKIKFLKDSYSTMQFFTREYGKVETEYTGRTLLRKPSFVFKGNEIYLTPIIPFDEFVYLDEKYCQLEEASFDAFLKTFSELEARNIPILEECQGCDCFQYCYGKGFFAIANNLDLPCIKQVI